MGKWVLTVAGIAILSVLCDVILPEGQTRKYVKTVFGVVVSLVIIQPLIELFSNGFGFTPLDSELVPQTQYIESVANRQNNYTCNVVWQLLDNKGLNVKNIQLNSEGDILTMEFDVDYDSRLNVVALEVAKAYFPNAEIVTIWRT